MRIVEGTPQESLMRSPQDATRVLEAYFSAGVRNALLYPENLTASGEAGEVLHKLRHSKSGSPSSAHGAQSDSAVAFRRFCPTTCVFSRAARRQRDG